LREREREKKIESIVHKGIQVFDMMVLYCPGSYIGRYQTWKIESEPR
jgi:hypothetical protein